MEEFQEKLDKIAKLPWRAALLALAVGFLFASMVSLIIGQVALPTEKDMRIESNLNQLNSNEVFQYITQTLSEEQLQAILDRNIFNSQGKFPDEDTPEEEGGGLVESQLPLRLVGTISGGNAYVGIAIIENKEKNATNSFMVGENVIESANVVLDEIYPQRIIISHNGRKEFIRLDLKNIVRISRKAKKGSGRSLSSSANESGDYFVEEGFERKGNIVRLTESYKSELLTTQLGKVLRDAKAEPRVGPDGRTNGWFMRKIKPDSIYLKMGIKEGDVVTEINGYSLNDPAKAVKVLKNLQKEEKFKIRVERNGAPFDIDMGVE